MMKRKTGGYADAMESMGDEMMPTMEDDAGGPQPDAGEPAEEDADVVLDRLERDVARLRSMFGGGGMVE